MSTPKRRPAGNQGQRPWQPMQRAVQVVPDSLQAMAARKPDIAAMIESGSEVWRNDRYVCHVRRNPEGEVTVLSVRRDDRKAIWDWRHLMLIKNEIAGEEIEAFQMLPAKSRTVDSANQYWIWCLPPGVKMPIGFEERVVAEQDPEFPLSRQRPFAEGENL
jgi:hypothetical protein